MENVLILKSRKSSLIYILLWYPLCNFLFNKTLIYFHINSYLYWVLCFLDETRFYANIAQESQLLSIWTLVFLNQVCRETGGNRMENKIWMIKIEKYLAFPIWSPNTAISISSHFPIIMLVFHQEDAESINQSVKRWLIA